jgi:7-carboxy-7-deazaguanine synthase
LESTRLLIHEIYPAISGESRFRGWPCVLVRLTGCHLRCTWCDSAHAFAGGESLTVSAVMARIAEHGHRTVLVTGGEPLLQKGVVELMKALLASGKRVLLETSGTLMNGNAVALAEVPAGVHRIVDIKPPASGIAESAMDWEGIQVLGPDDELKIVCADQNDYAWARALVQEGSRLPAGVPVTLSPVQNGLEPRDLAEWILADRLDVCFQIQLHKVVWPDAQGGV